MKYLALLALVACLMSCDDDLHKSGDTESKLIGKVEGCELYEVKVYRTTDGGYLYGQYIYLSKCQDSSSVKWNCGKRCEETNSTEKVK